MWDRNEGASTSKGVSGKGGRQAPKGKGTRDWNKGASISKGVSGKGGRQAPKGKGTRDWNKGKGTRKWSTNGSSPVRKPGLRQVDIVKLFETVVNDGGLLAFHKPNCQCKRTSEIKQEGLVIIVADYNGLKYRKDFQALKNSEQSNMFGSIHVTEEWKGVDSELFVFKKLLGCGVDGGVLAQFTKAAACALVFEGNGALAVIGCEGLVADFSFRRNEDLNSRFSSRVGSSGQEDVDSSEQGDMWYAKRMFPLPLALARKEFMQGKSKDKHGIFELLSDRGVFEQVQNWLYKFLAPTDFHKENVDRKIKLGRHLAERLACDQSFEDLNDEGLFLVVIVFVYTDSTQIDLPGGKRTLGETAHDCAMREAAEEALIQSNDLDFVKDLCPFASDRSPRNGKVIVLAHVKESSEMLEGSMSKLQLNPLKR